MNELFAVADATVWLTIVPVWGLVAVATAVGMLLVREALSLLAPPSSS